jgi:hypothetical protein
MNSSTKSKILKAAKSIAIFPDDFEQLHIKDCFIKETDWNDFNLKLYEAFNQVIMPDELDNLWRNNNTFEEMGQYIEDNL